MYKSCSSCSLQEDCADLSANLQAQFFKFEVPSSTVHGWVLYCCTLSAGDMVKKIKHQGDKKVVCKVEQYTCMCHFCDDK